MSISRKLKTEDFAGLSCLFELVCPRLSNLIGPEWPDAALAAAGILGDASLMYIFIFTRENIMSLEAAMDVSLRRCEMFIAKSFQEMSSLHGSEMSGPIWEGCIPQV